MNAGDIVDMLKARGKDQEALFALARRTRAQRFGDSAFLRGVVEISNICKQNCFYCGMRRDNRQMARYQMRPAEVVACAREMKAAGVNILFLQAGECNGTTEIVEAVCPQVKDELQMTVIACIGNRTPKQFERMAKAGIDGYILKHETSDEGLHFKLRAMDINERLRCVRTLTSLGVKVGGGNIIGLPGQTLESIAEDILLAKKLGVSYASASPFIPHEISPLAGEPCGDPHLTLNTMAILQLYLNVPVPTVSALDLLMDHGQDTGFYAGANVVTCNFTPERFRMKYSLYSQKRPNKSLQELVAMIHAAGLKVTNNGYAVKPGRPPHPAQRPAPNGLDSARVPGNIAKTLRPS
ncbi:MAG: radical SAM protein [Verrucomicrobiia bacterium]|jgi:biotin synthase